MILIIVILAALVAYVIAVRAIFKTPVKPYARLILAILAAVIIFGIAWLALLAAAGEAGAVAI